METQQMNHTIHTTHKYSFLIRAASLAGCIAFASALPAQTPALFPLEVGNTWLYRPAATNSAHGDTQEFRSIWVHGQETIAGRDYFDVSYFGREVQLRVEPSDGSVILYDRASGSEQPWLSLGLPVGGTFPTMINPCSTTGTIAAWDASVPTPAGTFANAVQVKFQGNCADAGVTQQFYAPYIGLVSSEETSFAGPVKYELFYYRVGASTASAQEVAFTVALDAPRYTAGSTLRARLTLRSSSPDPIHLHFPSGQSFDLKILDAKRNLVYLWSKGRAFTMIVRDETFGPGEQTYALEAPLTGLPPGRYTAEAYLTTDPLMYLGDVSFEIVTSQDPQAASKQGVSKQGVHPSQ